MQARLLFRTLCGHACQIAPGCPGILLVSEVVRVVSPLLVVLLLLRHVRGVLVGAIVDGLQLGHVAGGGGEGWAYDGDLCQESAA